MASATQHPSFPARPYSSTFHGKLPERSAVSTFGASSNRDTARLERERQERERSLREAQSQAAGGPSNPINNLTDEQRDEINEAVGHLLPQLLLYSKEWS
jgi:centrin-3